MTALAARKAAARRDGTEQWRRRQCFGALSRVELSRGRLLGRVDPKHLSARDRAEALRQVELVARQHGFTLRSLLQPGCRPEDPFDQVALESWEGHVATLSVVVSVPSSRKRVG